MKIPDAMRIKGYSPSKAADRSLQMQVRCEADKIKGEAIPGPPAPEAAAASALLTLSTTANVRRPALQTITTVLAAVSNLDAWFDNFRAFLIELDFAGVGDDWEPTFTKAQLRQIMNVDETEISLDTSNTRAGGRPAVSFHDPHLPATSRSTAKLLLACPGIFGSSAAGECVPPHFQLPTSATAKEREKIRFEFLTHTLDTRGRFGCAEEKIWPCTIGMNKKGGMTDVEFEKCINTSIVPLFVPELEDTPGKHVLLKVDSSPGRNGWGHRPGSMDGNQ